MMAVRWMCLIFSVLLVKGEYPEYCPLGGIIYTRGLSNGSADQIQDLHNKYRLQIAQGTVPRQPIGINLKRLKYDDALEKSAKIVSDTCVIQHKLGTDDRWRWVGQNLYMSWSSIKTTYQNWTEAILAWFIEHDDFDYPNTKRGMTGHYTQLVWATTSYIGCDFISFYDNDAKRARNPHAKLYSCNYGPGGNIGKQAPYNTGPTNECPNLC